MFDIYHTPGGNNFIIRLYTTCLDCRALCSCYWNYDKIGAACLLLRSTDIYTWLGRLGINPYYVSKHGLNVTLSIEVQGERKRELERWYIILY